MMCFLQVAYLLADISDVSTANIKDLYQKLENLSCKASIYDSERVSLTSLSLYLDTRSLLKL